MDIGLCVIFSLLPDLCIGLTRLCFQISGTSPVEMDKLKMYVSGPDKALSPAFIILTLIPSRPVDFHSFSIYKKLWLKLGAASTCLPDAK